MTAGRCNLLWSFTVIRYFNNNNKTFCQVDLLVSSGEKAVERLLVRVRHRDVFLLSVHFYCILQHFHYEHMTAKFWHTH
jgi:hypothetical protein